MEIKEKDYENLAKEEFYEVIQMFILPLLNTSGNLKLVDEESENNDWVKFINVDRNGKSVVRFYPCRKKKGINSSPFYCEINTFSTISMQKPLNRIMDELMKVTEYSVIGHKIKKQRDYGKKTPKGNAYKKRVLSLAFEVGMSLWVTERNENAITFYSVLCKMIDWSSKTYEGKRVPFGIVIDFNRTADENAISYVNFLDNNSSAVFSDGIFSGILLDKEGKLLSFITRNTPSAEMESKQEIFTPFKYIELARHCCNKAVGIIVQPNGEILIIKNRSICFAKRGEKWIAFDWSRLYIKLRPYFLVNTENLSPKELQTKEHEAESNIKKIYCTLLDVSFSHTGGCLAIILPDVLDNNISKVIKERIDISLKGTLTGISKESQERIEVLKHFLKDDGNGTKSFFDIDKELRSEILSLDGATVVALDGSFYCAGSIVSVASGSSGGGRTAAAKHLAEFGVGIKISEDGDIEAFGKPIGDVVQSDDKKGDRIIRLFSFK